MAYINDEDYRLVIGAKALDTISQVSEDIRAMAEREAVSEMAGYLRARYDVDAIFSKTGEARDPMLVMYGCDIALYHMSANLPQRQGTEVREERYEAARAWLKSVADGTMVPDLPLLQDTEGRAPFRIHSEPKMNNAW